MRFSDLTVIFIVTVLLTFTACGGVDKPVDYEPGEQKCTYCMMLIVDTQFRTQAITDKGKVHHFDAIECMLAWSYETNIDIKSMWVTDYYQPGRFINLNDAEIVKSTQIKSPMGANLASVEKSNAQKLVTEKEGQILQGDELREYINTWNSQKMHRHKH